MLLNGIGVNFYSSTKLKEINSYLIDIVIAVTYDEYFVYEKLIKDLLSQKIIISLQIMTIKTIGSQGQKFDERCFALIEKIKNDKNDIYIRLDGGINTKNFTKIVDLNIDEAIIGSGIFSTGNARENLNYFKDLC